MPEGIEISKRLVLINSLSTVLERVVNIGLVLWIHQFLVKSISPEEYKAYPAVMGLMATVPLLMGIVTGGMGRYAIEAYARNDSRRVTQVVSTMVPICFAGGLLILGCGILVTLWVDDLLNVDAAYAGDVRWMFGILVASTALKMALAPFKMGIQVRQKFLWAHLLACASQFLRLGVMFALLFGIEARALFVVVATVPSTIVEQIVTCTLSRRLVPSLRFDAREIRRELIRPIVSLGGWGMVSRISVVIREELTRIVLLHRASAAEAGAYQLGFAMDQRLRSSTLLPLFTTGPALTAMHATGQIGRLRSAYFKLGRYLLWAFSFAVVPLIVFRQEAWSLYLGPQEIVTYSSVVVIASFLFARAFLLFPVPAMAMVATSVGTNRPVGISALILESSNLVCVLLAILVFRGAGIGIAVALFAVGLVVYPIVHWNIGLRLTNSTMRQWLRATHLPGGIPALAALPVWFALQRLAPPTTWVALGLEFLAGALVFVGALALVLDPQEREDVGRVLRRLARTLRRDRGARDGSPPAG